MTDKQQNELLEKFINDSPLAEHIKVELTEHSQSYKPRFEGAKSYYDHAILLSSILMGAQHLMWWLRRNEYTITTKKRKAAENDSLKGYKISKYHK